MISLNRKLSTIFRFLVNSSNIRYWYTLNTCFLCDAAIHRPAYFCAPCLQDLPYNDSHCSVCSLPLYTHDASLRDDDAPKLRCGDCIRQQPSFAKAVTAFHYHFPISAVIQHVKYRNEPYWLEALAKQLARRIDKEYMHKSLPELIIPIPMHKNKLRRRGFNQSELIARQMSKALKIKLDNKVLRKAKESKAQVGLSKQERLRNLRNTLTIHNESQIRGKHLVLVDDVMTTCATAETCSQQLLSAGAAQVDIWALARTAKS